MGMEQIVTYTGEVPSWQSVASWLGERGLAFQMRMIDGQLAFPDEEPPETWNEIRVALEAGMISVRREPNRILCVIWGNAEPTLQLAWNALVLAFATVGEGKVTTPEGTVSAETYRTTVDLPPTVGEG